MGSVEVRAKIAGAGVGSPRRRWLKESLALFLLSAVGLVAGVATTRRAPEQPSVLLVSIDTLRADHVGVYGASSAETPHLDALGASGVVFEQAFAPVPLTLPSHTSLLTGLLPPRHGVRHNGLFRVGEVETLAARLSAEGYRTGAFVASMVLASQTGLARGFDTYDDTMSRQAFSAGVFLERSAREVTDAALRWLEAVEGKHFIWVHYYDPHQEHRAPAEIAARFPERPYDAEIAYVDRELGRLVEAFRRSAGRTTPLVIVTADHGESLGEHGESTHGYTLHDGVLRVPLIVSGATVPAGRRIRQLASLTDVAPTLLAILGLGPLRDVDGRDLTGAWASDPVPEASAPREIYAETLATRIDHGWAPLYSSRSPDWRYVRAPRPELYAHDVGADASVNLLEAEPGQASDALVQVVAEHDRAIRNVLATEIAGERHELDEETRGALVALGYAVPARTVAESGLDPKDGMVTLALYTEAVRSFAQLRYDTAQRLFEEVLAASPASADAHSMLSRTLIHRGELDRALFHARTATALVPGSARYLALLGMLELQLGNPNAAEASFERAAVHDSNVAELQVGLMWLAARAGRLAKAERHEARAGELGAGRWEIQQWIGTLWISLDRLAEAHAAFQRAAELAPEQQQPQADLALLWVRMGEDERAREALQRAGAASQTLAFRNRLAIAHVAGGDAERAIAIFEGVLRETPDYTPARNNLVSLRRALESRNDHDL